MAFLYMELGHYIDLFIAIEILDHMHLFFLSCEHDSIIGLLYRPMVVLQGYFLIMAPKYRTESHLQCSLLMIYNEREVQRTEKDSNISRLISTMATYS